MRYELWDMRLETTDLVLSTQNILGTLVHFRHFLLVLHFNQYCDSGSNWTIKKSQKNWDKDTGLSRNIFAGEYHSAFKGRGMAFSEVREYQFGGRHPEHRLERDSPLQPSFCKNFWRGTWVDSDVADWCERVERFWNSRKVQQELITEIAAILSFSAISNNDKIGVIFFSDRIEKFIPPKKGQVLN